MSLITVLDTDNGIVLDAAILVVSNISDNCRQDFHYSLPLNSNPGTLISPENEETIKFHPNESSNSTRTSKFQVAIFASEEHLRVGQPHIALLLDKATGQVNFPITFDDSSSDTKIVQAYNYLKTLYTDSVEIDLTDIDIK